MSERFFEITVFILGGMAYGLMEVLFRGHTHWSMVITGGACVLTLYLIMDCTMNLPLVVAALAGAGIITFYEFCVGMLVNVSFGWHVWDYSSMPGNILGQICPLFTGLWFAMCLVFFGLVRLFA